MEKQLSCANQNLIVLQYLFQLVQPLQQIYWDKIGLDLAGKSEMLLTRTTGELKRDLFSSASILCHHENRLLVNLA